MGVDASLEWASMRRANPEQAEAEALASHSRKKYRLLIVREIVIVHCLLRVLVSSVARMMEDTQRSTARMGVDASRKSRTSRSQSRSNPQP
jgi:hypothetical protein